MWVHIPRYRRSIGRFVSADFGQSMTEYALICALMAFGATAGYKSLADGVGNAFNHISTTFANILATGSGGGSGGSQSGSAGKSSSGARGGPGGGPRGAPGGGSGGRHH